MRVLLVSNNASVREQLRGRLQPLRWIITDAMSGAEALEALHTHAATEVLLLDPSLPDLLPDEFCGIIRQSFPHTEILTLNSASGNLSLEASSHTPSAGRLTAMLAHNGNLAQPVLLPKPAEYVRNPANGPKLRGVLGESPVMQRVFELTHMVAARDTTVLITGESGTGKDLVAQAIHQISPRRQAPFIVVNCAAIPEALLESELFGYAKGAFTGAMQSRIGRIHAAQGGTLFLDEIGDMPLVLQGKILRFVEQGEVQRLGSNDNMRVDVRIVAATNADLSALVKQKLFREDLFFRLSIFPIRLAPLREREDDISILAHSFATKFGPTLKLSDGAINTLRNHSWPGNVRELRNVMERASIIAGDAEEIDASHIWI